MIELIDTYTSRHKRILLQKILDILAVDSDTFLEDKCPRSLDTITTGCIVDPLMRHAPPHVEFCSHLGNIGLLDQATRTRTFAEKFDAC
jgi:hypothetical protein